MMSTSYNETECQFWKNFWFHALHATLNMAHFSKGNTSGMVIRFLLQVLVDFYELQKKLLYIVSLKLKEYQTRLTHTHTHTTIKDLHAERRPQMKTWSPFMQLSAPQWTSLLDSKLNLSFKCGCIILLELGPTYVIWLNKPYCTKIVAIKIMLLREMGRPKWSPPGVHLVPPLFTRDIRSVSSKFHLPNGRGRLC